MHTFLRVAGAKLVVVSARCNGRQMAGLNSATQGGTKSAIYFMIHSVHLDGQI